MKRLMTSLVLSAGLLAGTTVYAGPGGGYHHGGRDHAQYLAKKLDLTEEQKKAVAEIHSTYAKQDRKQQRHELMRDFAELDPAAADYQQKVAGIARAHAAKVEQSIIERGEIHAKVYEVLTPEQRTKWKALLEKRKARATEKAGDND